MQHRILYYKILYTSKISHRHCIFMYQMYEERKKMACQRFTLVHRCWNQAKDVHKSIKMNGKRDEKKRYSNGCKQLDSRHILPLKKLISVKRNSQAAASHSLLLTFLSIVGVAVHTKSLHYTTKTVCKCTILWMYIFQWTNKKFDVAKGALLCSLSILHWLCGRIMRLIFLYASKICRNLQESTEWMDYSQIKMIRLNFNNVIKIFFCLTLIRSYLTE